MWQHRFKNTYVINLPDRVDRGERVAGELQRLGVLRVRAGRSRSGESVRVVVLPQCSAADRQPFTRTGGVPHLSHALIWIRTLLDASIAPDDFVVVIEDDLKWCSHATNELIETLLAKVPSDANIVKFSVCDRRPNLSSLKQRGQVERVDQGVYLQTGILGGTLMYSVRKTALPTLIQFRLPRQL